MAGHIFSHWPLDIFTYIILPMEVLANPLKTVATTTTPLREISKTTRNTKLILKLKKYLHHIGQIIHINIYIYEYYSIFLAFKILMFGKKCQL